MPSLQTQYTHTEPSLSCALLDRELGEKQVQTASRIPCREDFV